MPEYITSIFLDFVENKKDAKDFPGEYVPFTIDDATKDSTLPKIAEIFEKYKEDILAGKIFRVYLLAHGQMDNLDEVTNEGVEKSRLHYTALAKFIANQFKELKKYLPNNEINFYLSLIICNAGKGSTLDLANNDSFAVKLHFELGEKHGIFIEQASRCFVVGIYPQNNKQIIKKTSDKNHFDRYIEIYFKIADLNEKESLTNDEKDLLADLKKELFELAIHKQPESKIIHSWDSNHNQTAHFAYLGLQIKQEILNMLEKRKENVHQFKMITLIGISQQVEKIDLSERHLVEGLCQLKSLLESFENNEFIKQHNPKSFFTIGKTQTQKQIRNKINEINDLLEKLQVKTGLHTQKKPTKP